MIITRAPLRIPLGGGGTDLSSYYSDHGGFILSAAIDKYVYIQVNKLVVEDFLRVKYSRTEKVIDPATLGHPLFRECLLHTSLGKGLEISAMADIPSGSGMGSSASFTVALLSALHTHRGDSHSIRELAEEAHLIERIRARQPAGKHDHYLAAYGGLTCLKIDRDGSVGVSPLRISNHATEELRRSMLLFYTHIKRESFDILSRQHLETQTGDKRVIDSLHEIKRLGHEIKKALELDDLETFGRLLDQHWQTKKLRSGNISNPDIDRWYDIGRQAGALGGKILGAGGGGFLMFFCATPYRQELSRAMAAEGLRKMDFEFDTEGSKVLVNL